MVPNLKIANLKSFTVAFWLNVQDVTIDFRLVAIAGGTAAWNGMTFQTRSSKLLLNYYQVNQNQNVIDNSDIVVNTWMHVALLVSPQSITFAKNGKRMSDQIIPITQYTYNFYAYTGPTYTFVVGSNGDSHTDMVIDDIKLYNISLSNTELQALSQS